MKMRRSLTIAGLCLAAVGPAAGQEPWPSHSSPGKSLPIPAPIPLGGPSPQSAAPGALPVPAPGLSTTPGASSGGPTYYSSAEAQFPGTKQPYGGPIPGPAPQAIPGPDGVVPGIPPKAIEPFPSTPTPGVAPMPVEPGVEPAPPAPGVEPAPPAPGVEPAPPVPGVEPAPPVPGAEAVPTPTEPPAMPTEPGVEPPIPLPAPPAVEPGAGGTDIPPPALPGGTTGGPEAAQPPQPGPIDFTAPGTSFGGPGDAGAAGGLGTDAFAGALAQAGQTGLGTFATPEVFGDSVGTSVLRWQSFYPAATVAQTPQPPPPLPRPPVPPNPPSPFNTVQGAVVVPTIRSIKFSENQSPAPRDRFIYQFNFYNDVNGSINNRFQSPISDINVYRHILGFEKTFFNQRTSIGVRMPIDTVTANSSLKGVGSTSTSVGDINIFTKWAFYVDQERGRLLSTGFGLTPTNGPARFGGASYLRPFHNPTIQPFVGGIFTFGKAYLQGFTSIEVPFTPNDVTLLYNDYAVGYFLYRSQDPDQFLSAVIPTFEVHVNTPLNHRGYSLTDPAGTPDFVNLTYGTAFMFGQRARFLSGIVTPVTGPRPFSLEVTAALNIYY